MLIRSIPRKSFPAHRMKKSCSLYICIGTILYEQKLEMRWERNLNLGQEDTKWDRVPNIEQKGCMEREMEHYSLCQINWNTETTKKQLQSQVSVSASRNLKGTWIIPPMVTRCRQALRQFWKASGTEMFPIMLHHYTFVRWHYWG